MLSTHAATCADALTLPPEQPKSLTAESATYADALTLAPERSMSPTAEAAASLLLLGRKFVSAESAASLFGRVAAPAASSPAQTTSPVLMTPAVQSLTVAASDSSFRPTTPAVQSPAQTTSPVPTTPAVPSPTVAASLLAQTASSVPTVAAPDASFRSIAPAVPLPEQTASPTPCELQLPLPVPLQKPAAIRNSGVGRGHLAKINFSNCSAAKVAFFTCFKEELAGAKMSQQELVIPSPGWERLTVMMNHYFDLRVDIASTTAEKAVVAQERDIYFCVARKHLKQSVFYGQISRESTSMASKIHQHFIRAGVHAVGGKCMLNRTVFTIDFAQLYCGQPRKPGSDEPLFMPVLTRINQTKKPRFDVFPS